MKTTYASLIAPTATLFSGTATMATDIYKGDKSLKDDSNYVSGPISSWTGFYITGALGVGRQDYDASRSVYRERGDYKIDDKGTKDTSDDVRVETPAAVNDFARSFSFENDDHLEGGLELSYKFQRGQMIFEPFVSANLAEGNEAGFWHRHDTQTTSPTGVPGLVEPGEGGLNVEKNWDGNLGLKVGFTPTPRVNLYLGGGLAYGNFDVSGGDALVAALGDTKGVYTYAAEGEESAWGYLLLAGAQYRVTDRVLVGIQGEYRDFGSIDVSSSRLVDDPFGKGSYARTNGKDEIDVTEFAVKGTLTIKLSD